MSIEKIRKRHEWDDEVLSEIDVNDENHRLAVYGQLHQDRAELLRVIEKLETEHRRLSEYHHPACRKMMYDIGSSPCTCEAETIATLDRIEAQQRVIDAVDKLAERMIEKSAEARDTWNLRYRLGYKDAAKQVRAILRGEGEHE